MPFRALIIDDEETYARALMRLLARRGVDAEHAATCAAGVAALAAARFDLVLLDHLLPDGHGLDLVRSIRARPAPAPEVLMMTAFGTIEHAVEAMRRGAFDYLTKTTALEEVVERVLDARRLAEARARGAEIPATVDASGVPATAATGAGSLTSAPAAATSAPSAAPVSSATRRTTTSRAAPAELLGDSPGIRAARARIAEVARSPDTTVLLTGESGTGKGVAARLLHALSARAAAPFVAIDCVALPPTLAESELFGHERGAFTGADRVRAGKLEAAGEGTVLLDEIGDMELGLQGKLLRVLEERAFERVGGVRSVPFPARVVAASHRDLARLVEERGFRLDLYHRLSVFPIALPALRDRGDDVILLARHFVAEFAARLGRPASELAPAVVELLSGYDFPGNVRELKNVIERAVILAPGSVITVEELPPRLLGASATSAGAAAPPHDPDAMLIAFRPGTDTLEDLERRLLAEALRLSDGKKGRAAALLGISRYALLRRVEKHGL